jgi:multidrug resistance efflux pump
MDVCSPKDGFVLKLFVQDKQEVKTGTPLLQMDNDVEDRNAEHIEALEAIREVRSSRYIGPQLDLLRKVAQNAVALAGEQANEAKVKYDIQEGYVKVGAFNGQDYLVAKSRYSQAQYELERAKDQQAQVEFAIARHTQTDALAKKLSETHLSFISKKKERLKLVAPRDGHVKLLVAEGSFAELGSVLMEIG